MASHLTSSIAAVLCDILQDLYLQRADRVKVEICIDHYLNQQKDNFKSCEAYWRYDQNMFIVRFKTTDSDQYHIVTHAFDYFSGKQPTVNPVDDYDRAMRGI
jgi:hypothetical protein